MKSVKTVLRKRVLFFVTIILFLISTFPLPTLAEDNTTWISLKPGVAPGTSSQILPKSSDNMGLCIDSNFLGMYNLITYINETRWNVLHVPNAGQANELGKPAVPMLTSFLEIPDDVQVTVEVIYQDMQVLEGFNVIPVQEPRSDHLDAPEPQFIVDDAVYATDAFYPHNIASLEGADGQDPIVIRGHRITALSLFPVQFNPVTQQIRAYSKIEVRLNYEKPAQLEPLDPRKFSPAFETLLDAIVLNYQPRPIDVKWAVQPIFWTTSDSPDGPDEGAEYLVITHPDFYPAVRDLATWKEKKGINTKIVNTTQIVAAGLTANDVEAYVQNAYDTWNPAPTYVLLVGDSDHIPPHYLTPHPDPNHGNFEIPTDLHFVTVEGNDYFQDIYIGRLSVDTLPQATTVVDKILDYERNPPADADFYNQVTACAQFQDENSTTTIRNGFEDRRFVLTSEEIRDYLIQAEGYTVDRIYWARDPDPALFGGQDPTNYNGAGDSNNRYDNGDPLPPDLLWPGFAWDGDTLDITNNITDGRFLIYHRDHGSSANYWAYNVWGGGWGAAVDGWSHPEYDTGDIAWLANAPLLPVVFSIECQCGWFDGEVDQLNDPNLTRNTESFCEEFVRQPGGGAIATIGSARNSYSGYNDDMLRGFVDAIWPDFDPSFSSGGLYSLGQVLTYGKVYMATFRPPPDDVLQMTFEEFHLFGDPELSIWTEQPGVLDVAHPTDIGSQGSQKFVVNVTDFDTGKPVHYAKVCLQKGTDVYSFEYTDQVGVAYFSVAPSTGGEMNVTVTKHNYRPYEGLIAVTGEGATLTINPDSGPAGSVPTLQMSNFVNGESVEIFFGGTVPDATVTAGAGSFTTTVTVPTGPVGPINVRAVGASGRTAVALFRRLPDQPLPDPYTYCQWDSSTWHLNPNGGDPRWNSPSIQLYDASTGNQVASNDLEVGTTYTVKADIHNAASEPATDTRVTFQWGDWGMGQRIWNEFGTDTVDIPGLGTATAEANWTPSITGHTCLMVTIYHPYDENLENNKGQENTDVHPVSSPGEIVFSINNPTEETALVYLNAKQIGRTDLWAARIDREYPQVQEPGEVLNGTLLIAAPDEAEVGEMRAYTVSGYIDGELIGGVEIYVVVKLPTTISCAVSPVDVVMGDSVTVSGSISPMVADGAVTLSYGKPDGTTVERTVTTGSDGSYDDSYQPDATGSWSVSASWEGDSTHMSSESSTESFNVEKRTPCQILLTVVLAILAIIIYYTRRQSRELRILGLIICLIILLVYYWYCVM